MFFVALCRSFCFIVFFYFCIDKLQIWFLRNKLLKREMITLDTTSQLNGMINHSKIMINSSWQNCEFPKRWNESNRITANIGVGFVVRGESPGCRLISTVSMLECWENSSPTTHRGAIRKDGAEIPWGWSLPECFTSSGGF